jgi:putative glutamine amidotransferase
MNKLRIGFTGPSLFLEDIKSTIVDYYKATPIYIDQNEQEDLDFMVNMIDGLILSGGSDIHPSTLGRNVTRFDGYSKFDIARDRREIYLLDKCIELNKPVLGICRGHQLIGTQFNFHLIDDISRSEICHSPGADEIKLNYEAGEYPHFINVLPEFQKEWGIESDLVNSAHHQCLAFFDSSKKFNGFNVIATADTNTDEKKNQEIIELMVNSEKKIISCQWHPESIWKFDNLPSIKVLERFEKYLK